MHPCQQHTNRSTYTVMCSLLVGCVKTSQQPRGHACIRDACPAPDSHCTCVVSGNRSHVTTNHCSAHRSCSMVPAVSPA